MVVVGRGWGGGDEGVEGAILWHSRVSFQSMIDEGATPNSYDNNCTVSKSYMRDVEYRLNC